MSVPSGSPVYILSMCNGLVTGTFITRRDDWKKFTESRASVPEGLDGHITDAYNFHQLVKAHAAKFMIEIPFSEMKDKILSSSIGHPRKVILLDLNTVTLYFGTTETTALTESPCGLDLATLYLNLRDVDV